MADESNTTPTTPNTVQPSAGGTPANQTVPTSAPTTDSTKMAEELGHYKKVAEDFETYKKQVDPVLETVFGSPELFQQLTDVHNKRMGITPTDKPKVDDKIQTNQPSQIEKDNRNAIVTQIVTDFESKHGLDKLAGDQKKEMNIKIGNMLAEMLDPNGNKPVGQIMEEVSATKLPKFLEHAYYLATKDEQLEAAKNIGRQQANSDGTGIIGSIPSGSATSEEVTLTAKERETAKKMGIPEDKYLQRKKEIVEAENAPL